MADQANPNPPMAEDPLAKLTALMTGMAETVGTLVNFHAHSAANIAQLTTTVSSLAESVAASRPRGGNSNNAFAALRDEDPGRRTDPQVNVKTYAGESVFFPLAANQVDAEGTHRFASNLPYGIDLPYAALAAPNRLSEREALVTAESTAVYALANSNYLLREIVGQPAIWDTIPQPAKDAILRLQNSMKYFTAYATEQAALRATIALGGPNATICRALARQYHKPLTGSDDLDADIGGLLDRTQVHLEKLVAQDTARKLTEAARDDSKPSASKQENAKAAAARIERRSAPGRGGRGAQT